MEEKDHSQSHKHPKTNTPRSIIAASAIALVFLFGLVSTVIFAIGYKANNDARSADNQLRKDLKAAQSDLKTLKEENDQLMDYMEKEQEEKNANNQASSSDDTEDDVSVSSVVPTVPADCAGYIHKQAGQKMKTYEDIKNGFVGTWFGCVTTPWIDPYRVEVTFREDGTYSAKRDDGEGPAFYYGADDDHASKVYSIDDLLDNGKAAGTIIVYFNSDTTNSSQLRNIVVYEKTMSFEYWHRGEYGPIKFELVKAS